MDPSEPEQTHSHCSTDPVIGLDVAGTVHYCRKSTLLNKGNSPSYFDGRFGPETMLDSDIEYVDKRGREVYFIDRDPDLFKYILQYLRHRQVPWGIGSFQDNPHLWRALRREAAYFCLDELSFSLNVTFSCSPEQNGLKGVLHWLGTNKQKEEYKNPYSSGSVDVTGHFLGETERGTMARREFFVQYRGICKEFLSEYSHLGERECQLGLINCSSSGCYIIVDLKSVTICVSHYSLRYGGCFGMAGDWNFEVSNDAINWVVLHEAKNDNNLIGPTGIDSLNEVIKLSNILRGVDGERRSEEYCDYMERNFRHVWRVNRTDGFFRYLRIVQTNEENRCLHCVGLEIYGDVHED